MSVLGIIDYFVVVDAPNRRLVRTLVDDVEVGVREVGGRSPLRVEGEREQQWVLIDYGDVVVHIFLDEVRRFYEIERLYRDVPTIPWDSDAARAALGWRSVRSSLESLLATARWCSPTGRPGRTTSTWASDPASHPSCGTSIIPRGSPTCIGRFVDAGADIILTNTFGCNRNRLSLHRAEDRVFELAKAAAAIARTVADAADRPIVVAGSVGPTGELFAPLGGLTHDRAVAAFREQIEGLVAGGIDVAWIETMSAPEEVRAAATAAIEVGVPYTATCSFDTAGRTMMGLSPGDLGRVFDGPDGRARGLWRQLWRGRPGHPRVAAGHDCS